LPRGGSGSPCWAKIERTWFLVCVRRRTSDWRWCTNRRFCRIAGEGMWTVGNWPSGAIFASFSASSRSVVVGQFAFPGTGGTPVSPAACS
jgi:hypothetical protein